MARMHKTFAFVALAVAATSSPLALAAQSKVAAQCVALVNQDKLDEAKPSCAAAAEEPGKEGKVLYAGFLSRTGDFKSAIEAYSELLDGVDLDSPTDAEYDALRSRALVRFYVQGAGADEDAAHALKLHPRDVELLEMGAQNSPEGQKRLVYADQLVTIDPKSVEHLVLRCYALVTLQRGQDALGCAEAALKMDPKSPSALSARAFAYQTLKENSKAERDFSAVARMVPNAAGPRVNLAELLGGLRRYDDAIEQLTAALKLEPDNTRALLARADYYLATGNGEAALADAKKINPSETAYDMDDLQEKAEEMAETMAALQPESVAMMERDRATVLGVMERHMHKTCGYFDVRENSDNDALDEYWDCLQTWTNSAHGDDFYDSFSADENAAYMRFYKTADWIDEGDELVCSKMPKKSRCIDDKTQARAVAMLDMFSNPKSIVSDAEFDRLNKGVDAHNARVRRQNALDTAGEVLKGIAEGLSSQQ